MEDNRFNQEIANLSQNAATEQDVLFPEPVCEMNIISALDEIQENAKGSHLSDEFWADSMESFDYLCQRFEMSREAVLLIAILCETGEGMSWKHVGEFLRISRLKAMSFTPAFEELRDRRWAYQCGVFHRGTNYWGFKLVFGIIDAFRHNEVFVPEKIEGLTEQAFIDRLIRYVRTEGRDTNILTEENNRWMMQLTEANPQLPLCRKVLDLDAEEDKILLLLAVADYAQYAGRVNEGLLIRDIRNWFGDSREAERLEGALMDGQHEFFGAGIFEYGSDDGMVDTEHYLLTAEAKQEFAGDYTVRNKRVRGLKNEESGLRKSEEITPKALFYNEAERHQIERLKSLLSADGFSEVQNRLAESGLRRGVACLFYGAPGTGKTETVLQLARETGRDIMQVDIAGLRDKWVGESEKNIKDVFDSYRNLCKEKEVTPILFFNEADAIIGSRLETTRSSVEKMDNAMQNIILQEIENLDGILIATTNLTGNLDRAFDRRFLFKVEFTKPGVEAKKSIWHTMMPDISEDDCLVLAKEFDFSGGEIENISRKSKIEYVLSGTLPGLNELRLFCSEERLSRGNNRKVGFSF